MTVRFMGICTAETTQLRTAQQRRLPARTPAGFRGELAATTPSFVMPAKGLRKEMLRTRERARSLNHRGAIDSK
jgi:hypothetical protein